MRIGGIKISVQRCQRRMYSDQDSLGSYLQLFWLLSGQTFLFSPNLRIAKFPNKYKNVVNLANWL